MRSFHINLPPVLVCWAAAQADINGIGRKGIGDVFAPLHGAYAAAIEIIVPADVIKSVAAAQAVYVKVEQGDAPRIFVDQRKSGAGDALRAAQAAASPRVNAVLPIPRPPV